MGRHANMQDGDGEAFCSVMRKGRGRHCEWCRRVCICLCACVYMCFSTDSLGCQSDGGYRSQCHLKQSPVEQHGMEYHQSSHTFNLEGCSLLLWPLFHLRDISRKRWPFFSFFSPKLHHYWVTVNPHGAESANIVGKLRRKRTGKFFSLTPPLQPYFVSLLLICGREPMVHYNWPLSSCRWHTVSALNIISAFCIPPLFFLFFSPFFSFLRSEARFAIQYSKR